MRRDMDLIRDLLLHIKDEVLDGSGYGLVSAEELSRTANEILYHMILIAEAGFVIEINRLADGNPLISGLSWKGCEFLDTIRDPEVWKKTKQGAALAGGFTVDLLKDLAKGFLKKQIEDRTGIKL